MIKNNEMFLFVLIVLLLLVFYFNIPKQQESICIDCLVGHLGGGCTYIDENGNVIQPSPCFPYDTNRTKYNCSDESRNVDACIEIYRPVCGSDAKTYSNSCFACMNPTVSFYLEGDCSEIIEERYCNVDADCSCGVHIRTGDCFYGNEKYVDESRQCPDFCTGISGNLYIKCVNKECVQVSAPQNYTIAKVTDIACNKDDECETPVEYLIRSSCPFTSKCINNKCTVICPDFNESQPR